VTRATLSLACLGGLLLALTLGALMLHVPGADTVGTPALANIFVGVLVIALAVYLAAVRLILRTEMSRAAIWIICGVAVAMRAALLPALPFLSSDIYRYVWDGQVQAAGINPYRYVPADPALAALRDPAVYPLINRAAYAHTIYPPAAQAIFGLVGQMTRTVTGMKVAMVIFEIIAVACMLRLLALAGLPRERVLIYAWNPLALWSFACDGHVDAVVVGLMAIALLCRAHHRESLAGSVLAAAMLVKFLPIAVVPAFVRGGKLWQPALAGTVVVFLLYAIYVSAGAHVLGFLPTYGAEEGFDDGSGFWLLAGLSHLFTLPRRITAIYICCVAAAFGGLALWISRGRRDVPANDVVLLCRDTAILAACATAAIGPHYAWYFAWLALPCVVAPVPAVIWLSAAPVIFFIDPFNERFFWPSLVYLPAAALTLAAIWRRHFPSPAALAISEGSF
jgi:alpha-1,6-mannosyltransferase